MALRYFYTEKDSTKNKPHYTVNYATDDYQFIGMYEVHGYLLENVFVDEKFRDKGYCKFMVSKAVEKKKNLHLFVKKDNKPAIRCYKSCGFKEVSRDEVFIKMKHFSTN